MCVYTLGINRFVRNKPSDHRSPSRIVYCSFQIIIIFMDNVIFVHLSNKLPVFTLEKILKIWQCRMPQESFVSIILRVTTVEFFIFYGGRIA